MVIPIFLPALPTVILHHGLLVTVLVVIIQHSGLQLKALGVIPSVELEFDTDCMQMLEVMYEDLGDVVALQYGGSNLVHRVQSYRKTDLLSSHSNDILQTISRYVRNSFSGNKERKLQP